MGVDLLVGTQKGALILRSDSLDGGWRHEPLRLKGWLVTSFARDAAGRTYAGVTHDVWGACVMASDDLETWEQLEGAPRYAASEVGSHSHNRIIGAMDPDGAVLCRRTARRPDLEAAGRWRRPLRDVLS